MYFNTTKGEQAMTTVYEITGTAGAGYKTRMIWRADENKWVRSAMHDGTGSSFKTEEAALAELRFAQDPDIDGIAVTSWEADDE
jgi:hypothetical protein